MVSARTMVERHEVGKDAGALVWRTLRSGPWPFGTLQLSNDPGLRLSWLLWSAVLESAGTGGGVQFRC